MSINLHLNQSQLNDSSSSGVKVHYMPATIKGDGPAKVDMFFNKDAVDENGVVNNSFRGHPLQGCAFPLPNPYKGLIFREMDSAPDENANRVLKFDGGFDSLHYWNYDKVPSRGDAFRQMWDIATISETMCVDVSMDDIEKKMRKCVLSAKST